MTVTIEQARRVVDVVGAGLAFGRGERMPGEMCVEAAVCYALGLPHGDDPPCVGESVRRFAIRLNDSRWSSSAARAQGMRRLAVAQLGSDEIDQTAFRERIARVVITRFVPLALRAAAKQCQSHAEPLEAAAVRCETEGTREAALNAKTAAYAAEAVAYADEAAYAAAEAASAAEAVAIAADEAAYATNEAASAAAVEGVANADEAAYAAGSRDEILTLAADCCVQVLRDMGAPGIALMDKVFADPA